MPAKGKTVGSINVRVLPDTSLFPPSLKKFLDRQEQTTKLQISIIPDMTGFREKIKEQTRNLPNPRIAPDVDARAAQAQLAVLTRPRKIEVDLDLDKSGGLRLTSNGLKSLGSAGVSSLGAVTAAGNELSRSFLSISKYAAASVLAVGALGSAASGLGSLVTVAASAAGSVALIPAAIGVAGAGFAAVKVGASGVAEAFKAIGEQATATGKDAVTAQKATAEALDKLSPKARDFALEVQKLAPAWLKVKAAVQDALFSGLDAQLSTIGKQYLPILSEGLSGVASSANEAASGLLTMLGEARNAAGVTFLFQGARDVLANLAAAVAPIGQAFLDIAIVGVKVLNDLTGGAGNAAVKFRDFIAAARESGKLEEFLRNSVEALKTIGNFLKDLAKIAFNVFSNFFKGFNQEDLRGTKSLLGQIAEFTGSEQGKQFFQTLGSIMGDISRTLGPAVIAILKSVGQTIALAAPGIQAFATGFANFLTAIAPVIPAIGELASVLGTSLGEVFTQLGPILAPVIRLLAEQLATAIPLLIPGIIAIAKFFGDLLAAVAPLLPPLTQLASEVLVGLLDAITPLLKPLAEMVGSIIKGLIPYVGPLARAFGDLVRALIPLIEPITKLALQIVNALAPVIGPLATAFVSLVDALVPIIAPMLDLATSILPPLIGLLQPFIDLLNPILEIFKALITPLKLVAEGWAAIGSALGPLLGLTSNQTAATRGAESAFKDLNPKIGDVTDSLEDLNIESGKGLKGLPQSITDNGGQAIHNTAGVIGTIKNQLDIIDGYGPGADIMDGMARGIIDAGARAVRSANSVMQDISRQFPHSPAKEGPFSGKGWTPYSGRALMEGFAKGIRDGAPSVLDATNTAMTSASTMLNKPFNGLESDVTIRSEAKIITQAEAFANALENVKVEVAAGQVTRVVNETNIKNTRR
jgi:phage-related protein